jgi:DNA-binding response OmpR family regulator
LQACREYELHQPEVVTMDITMPVMDGVTAVKRILADYPKALIIMISAIDQKNMVMAALENGARHYIIKPFSPEKVLASVDTVLKKFGGQNMQTPSSTASPAVIKGPDKQEPFTIENRNGTFIVSIAQQFTNNHIPALNQTIQAFLAVKPLRIVFDFGPTQVQEFTVISNILDIMNRVKQAGGLVMARAEDLKIVKIINEKGFDCN